MESFFTYLCFYTTKVLIVNFFFSLESEFIRKFQLENKMENSFEKMVSLSLYHISSFIKKMYKHETMLDFNMKSI